MKVEENTPTAKIFNSDDKDVTDRVLDGRTAFFFNVDNAKDYAKKRRTFHYDAYDGNGNPVGYCVPK